jgi:hypothetical protein
MYLEDWILPSEINENTKQFYIEIWYLWQLLGQELFSCFKHTDVKWLFLKFLICGTDWQLTFNNFCCEIQYRPFYYLRTILSSSVFIVHLQPIGTAFQLHLVHGGRKGWTWSSVFFSPLEFTNAVANIKIVALVLLTCNKLANALLKLSWNSNSWLHGQNMVSHTR